MGTIAAAMSSDTRTSASAQPAGDDHAPRAHPRRKNTRAAHIDYRAPGAYFVTLCTEGRVCVFGEVDGDGVFRPTPLGDALQRELLALPARFPRVSLDAYVVMPNHVHALIVLHELVGVGLAPPVPSPASSSLNVSLSDVVGAFKSLSARASGGPLWQRSFHDHVIRDAADLAFHRRYIDENPLRWALDELNPEARRA